MQHNWDGTVVSSTCQLCFTPKQIPWYPFLLEAAWIPRLLNVNRRNRSLQKFQRTLRGIEPGTSCLVAQCFNQLLHTCHQSDSTLTINVSWKSTSFIMTVQGLILKGLIFITFKIIPILNRKKAEPYHLNSQFLEKFD